MNFEISMLEGYVTPRGGQRSTNKRSITMKLGTAARACKGKQGGEFRKCIKQKMRGGKKSRRSRRRRSRR